MSVCSLCICMLLLGPSLCCFGSEDSFQLSLWDESIGYRKSQNIGYSILSTPVYLARALSWEGEENLPHPPYRVDELSMARLSLGRARHFPVGLAGSIRREGVKEASVGTLCYLQSHALGSVSDP